MFIVRNYIRYIYHATSMYLFTSVGVKINIGDNKKRVLIATHFSLLPYRNET